MKLHMSRVLTGSTRAGSPSANGQHQQSNVSACQGPWREGMERSVVEVSGRQEETPRT